MARLPFLPQIYMGKGIDSSSGKTYGQAIDFDPPDKTAGQDVSLTLESVSSSTELTERIEVSANVSLAATAWGASAEFKLTKAQSINSYYTYAIVRVQVQNPPWVLKNPKLRTEAKDLLVKKGWNVFFANYGTEYVEGLITGGSFYAMIEIQTKSESEQNNVKADLSAHYGIFTAKGDLSTTLQNINKSTAVNVYEVISGGSGDILQISIDDMIKKATAFPATVKEAPVTIWALTNNYYGSVPIPGDVPAPDSLAMQQQRDTLNDLGREYLRLRDYKANIEFILEHLPEFDQYRSLDAAALQGKRQEFQTSLSTVGTELDNIVKRANACGDNRDQCKTYTPSIGSLNLPTIGGQHMSVQQLEDKIAALEKQLNDVVNGAQALKTVILDGDLHFNGPPRTVGATARLHISGEELLYLLNKSGVVISKAWGGNGNLTVEGAIRGELVSNNGNYHMVVQDDRNIVLYDRTGGQNKPVWASHSRPQDPPNKILL